MTGKIESRLRGLSERRMLCLKELEVHLARGSAFGAGISSCIEQIERINAEMLKLAASMDAVKEPAADVVSSGM